MELLAFTAVSFFAPACDRFLVSKTTSESRGELFGLDSLGAWLSSSLD